MPEPAYHAEPDLHRAPLHEERPAYDAADSLALHMDHDRSASDAPMLSAAREDDRSGLRVFAFAAGAALLVILAVAFYLMRGPAVAPSEVATTVDDVLETERVNEATPVPPSGSSSAAASEAAAASPSQPDTAATPPVAPVIQEPPSATAAAPPRAAESRGTSPASRRSPKNKPSGRSVSWLQRSG